MATRTIHRTGRSLVVDTLFNRLVERIVREENMPQPLASRIMDQALAFLAASATADETLAPSKMVDITGRRHARGSRLAAWDERTGVRASELLGRAGARRGLDLVPMPESWG